MKVSVCLLTYNHEKYIAQAIESVLDQQADFDIEIIIGEDQSSDGTRDIVLFYLNKYPEKIKVFLHEYPENYKRVSGRKNLVNNILNAAGDYIALLDGDDYWTDSLKLQKQVDFLDSHPSFSAVFHWADWFEDCVIHSKAYGPPLVKDFYTVDDLLEYSNFIPTCTAMFRRSLITEFPDWFYICPYGDLPLHIMNALKGDIGFIDCSMAVYRVHKGGIYASRSEVNKQINNLYAFELIAANLNLQERSGFLSYTESRMQDIRLLIGDNTALKEADQLINSIPCMPGDLVKINRLKNEIKMKLCNFNSQDVLQLPELTVIICTYNRENVLPACLNSLCRQTISSDLYDVIVVNNNSSDNTKSVTEEFACKMPNFRVLEEPMQGLSCARNTGLKEARTNYVAYIDDDARVPENWVEMALKIIKEFGPDIFGGPAYPIYENVKPAWFKDEYAIRGNMGATGWIHDGFIVGTNIFFKKSLLVEYGGFDTDLGMKGDNLGYHEETAIVFRAFEEKRKVYYSSELAVQDLFLTYKLSLAYYIQSQYKIGTDGVSLWGHKYGAENVIELLELIDVTMNEIDISLRKRDQSIYEFPENYIIENVINKFTSIGLMVGFYLRNKEALTQDINVNLKNTAEADLGKAIVSNKMIFKVMKSIILAVLQKIVVKMRS